MRKLASSFTDKNANTSSSVTANQNSVIEQAAQQAQTPRSGAVSNNT